MSRSTGRRPDGWHEQTGRVARQQTNWEDQVEEQRKVSWREQDNVILTMIVIAFALSDHGHPHKALIRVRGSGSGVGVSSDDPTPSLASFTSVEKMRG